MRTDTAYTAGGVQLQGHRVAQLQRSDPTIADHDPRVAGGKLPVPAQFRDRAVYRAKEDPQIITPAKYHVARQRRDQFGVLSQRLSQRVNVVLLGGGAKAGDSIHTTDGPTATTATAGCCALQSYDEA